MNRQQYIEHLRTVALGLHLDGIQKWADLIVDNIHWVKQKDLTDEEIKQIFLDETGFDFDDNPGDGMALMDFARAILKRANEK